MLYEQMLLHVRLKAGSPISAEARKGNDHSWPLFSPAEDNVQVHKDACRKNIVGWGQCGRSTVLASGGGYGRRSWTLGCARLARKGSEVRTFEASNYVVRAVCAMQGTEYDGSVSRARVTHEDRK